MPGAEHSQYADLTLYSTGYAKQVDLGFGGFGILNKPLSENTKEVFSIDIEVDDKPFKVAINSFPMQLEEYFKKITERKSIITAHKNKLNSISLHL